MSAVTDRVTDSAAVTRVRRARRTGSRRRGVVITALALALAVVALASLGLGDIALAPGDVIAALTGHGSPLATFVVMNLRLPRLLTALLVGVALALAGSLFQSTLRNPLASPDILGISGGASCGAVVAQLLLHRTGVSIPLFAMAGGVLVAGVIAALSWGTGPAGQRFVLIGVAMAFAVSAVLGYLLTRADVQEAAAAFVWLVGSIGSPDWSQITALALALLVLVPITVALTRPVAVLQLGDDPARGLGVRTRALTAGALATATALAAVAIAVAGPVAFVAFVCAPIARRLVAAGGVQPAAVALTGALLVSAADVVAANLPGDVEAPVGLVTALLGAPYLLALLAARTRAGQV